MTETEMSVLDLIHSDGLYREQPKSLFSIWQHLNIGHGDKTRLAWLEETCARLLLYNQLLSKYGIRPKGILYLGANIGQLLWVWILMGFRHIFMAEPQPSAFAKLEKWAELSSNVLLTYETFTGHDQPIQIQIAPCAIGDFDGHVDFFTTANSNLSSLLKPAQTQQSGLRSDFGAHMRLKETIRVPIRTMDSIFAQSEGGLDSGNFNAVYMNLQGAELKALAGMADSLAHIEFIYLENNFIARYEGCPSADELHAFLAPLGFEPVWGQVNSAVGNGFTAYTRVKGT